MLSKESRAKLMEQPLVKILIGIMTAVVLAVSGAVWKGQQDLAATFNATNLDLQKQLTALQATQSVLIERMEKHEDLPAHGDVLRYIDRLNVQLDEMRRFADRSDRRWREMQQWLSNQNSRHAPSD